MQSGCLIDFRASTSAVLPFGELVLAQDQSLAFWLGRCEATDQHILAKANSNSLVKSNTVTRLSLDSSMDLIKSSSLPPPEPPPAVYLKMAELGDQPTAKVGGEEQLRMEFPPQAYNNQPQQKAKGKHRQKENIGTASFITSWPRCIDRSSLAKSALPQPHELQLTALHPPVVQQLASAATALIAQVIEPTSRSNLLKSKLLISSRKNQKGTDATANKLQSILEKARTFQKIELAVRYFRRRISRSTSSIERSTASCLLRR